MFALNCPNVSSSAFLTSTVREKLIEQGLVIFPVAQAHRREGILSIVDVTYRIVNTENPDEHIDVVSSGSGADTQDKGVGKAITYAYKYMIALNCPNVSSSAFLTL